MRFFLLLFILLLSACVTTPPPVAAVTPAPANVCSANDNDLRQHVAKAMPDGPGSQATAWQTTWKGLTYIVMTAHKKPGVYKVGDTFTLEVSHQPALAFTSEDDIVTWQMTATVVHVIYDDDAEDVAILVPRTSPWVALRTLKLADFSPAYGRPVAVPGYPAAVYEVGWGMADNYDGPPFGSYFKIPQMFFGASGSPVLSCNGKVGGMLVATNLAEGFSVAIPPMIIQKALQAAYGRDERRAQHYANQ